MNTDGTDKAIAKNAEIAEIEAGIAGARKPETYR
jgi:hypothetical protein